MARMKRMTRMARKQAGAYRQSDITVSLYAEVSAV